VPSSLAEMSQAVSWTLCELEAMAYL
jgi:hypothetical protein